MPGPGWGWGFGWLSDGVGDCLGRFLGSFLSDGSFYYVIARGSDVAAGWGDLRSRWRGYPESLALLRYSVGSTAGQTTEAREPIHNDGSSQVDNIG